MKDALVDLKRPSKWRDTSLARAAFSSVFGNFVFHNKSVITLTNFMSKISNLGVFFASKVPSYYAVRLKTSTAMEMRKKQTRREIC